MTLLLEKLSRYWQLRFLAIGAGIALIVFASLLPDPGNESRDTTIQSVAAAPLHGSETAERPSTPAAAAPAPSAPISIPAPAGAIPWMGENADAVNQLRLLAGSEGESESPIDASELARGLRKAAERGDPASQFLLGHSYQLGLGVSKDMTETARWYGLAAQARPQGGELAGATSSKPVVSFGQAFDIYRALAEQGDVQAELYMGVAYDLGKDVPRNAGEAVRWYRKAAAQGSASAAANLGALYSNGNGIPKDDVEAARWFRSAAERGSASAQYSLGRMYWTGGGVAADPGEAAVWLQKAATQGNARAQVLLSLMYATGQGVAGSTPTAYMWLNLASARDDEARASREQVEKAISNTEIAEGQKSTHDWLAQHGGSMR